MARLRWLHLPSLLVGVLSVSGCLADDRHVGDGDGGDASEVVDGGPGQYEPESADVEAGVAEPEAGNGTEITTGDAGTGDAASDEGGGEGDPGEEGADDGSDEGEASSSSVLLCAEVGGDCLTRRECPPGEREHEEAVCMGPKTCCVPD